MSKQYHILNGDSLKDQFPESLKGELIIARECLVDGNVKGNTLDEFFESRADFISTGYEGLDKQDYYSKTVPEFLKIQNILRDAEINLWFEDDLFCQVNFWFVTNLLVKNNQRNPVFLVRPKVHTQYGFGGLDKSELTSIFQNRLLLTGIEEIASLWSFYQNGETKKLLQTAKELKTVYPFILPAVEAHIHRIPTEGNPGRPVQSLLQIMNELDTREFGPVFREFNKRESIYGFGDLQVRRIFDSITD